MYTSIPYTGPISLQAVKSFFTATSDDDISTRDMSVKYQTNGIPDSFSEFRGKCDIIYDLVSWYDFNNYGDIEDTYLIDEHSHNNWATPNNLSLTRPHYDGNGTYWELADTAYIDLNTCVISSHEFTIYLGVNCYRPLNHTTKKIIGIGYDTSHTLDIWIINREIVVDYNYVSYYTGLRFNLIDDIPFQPLVISMTSNGLELYLHNQLFTVLSTSTKMPLPGWSPDSSSYYHNSSISDDLTGSSITLSSSTYNFGLWSRKISDIERQLLAYSYRLNNDITSTTDIHDDLYRFYEFARYEYYLDGGWNFHNDLDTLDYLKFHKLKKYGSFSYGVFYDNAMYYDNDKYYYGYDGEFSISVTFRVTDRVRVATTAYYDMIFEIGNEQTGAGAQYLQLLMYGDTVELQYSFGGNKHIFPITFNFDEKYTFTMSHSNTDSYERASLNGNIYYSQSNTNSYELNGYLTIGAEINDMSYINDSNNRIVNSSLIGQVYDFMIWKRAISSDDMKHLYERSTRTNRYIVKNISYSNLTGINDMKESLKYYYTFDNSTTDNTGFVHFYDVMATVNGNTNSHLHKIGGVYNDGYSYDNKTSKLYGKHGDGVRYNTAGGYCSDTDAANGECSFLWADSYNLTITETWTISLWFTVDLSYLQYSSLYPMTIYSMSYDYENTSYTSLVVGYNTSTLKHEIILRRRINFTITDIVVCNIDIAVYGTTNWYHLVLTSDNNGNKETLIYVNGVLKTTESIYVSGHGIFYLAANMSCAPETKVPNLLGTGKFSGSIDEIGMWSRILNQTTVSRLYNDGNGYYFDNFN